MAEGMYKLAMYKMQSNIKDLLLNYWSAPKLSLQSPSRIMAEGMYKLAMYKMQSNIPQRIVAHIIVWICTVWA
jgi:hypothetical protein